LSYDDCVKGIQALKPEEQKAAELRAKYSIMTPDAIQIAWCK